MFKKEETQSREALKRSVDRLQALMDEAPIGICHTDLKGKVTYVNKRFEEGSGYSREEIVGKNGLKLGLFSNETLRFLGKRMKEKLIGKPPSILDAQFKRKDGQWIWVGMEARLIRERGIPVGFQILSRNITERKRAEEALRKAHNELEMRVEERTAELTKANEELRTEITERKRMEQELQESENKYRVLLENLPQKIFLKDKNSVYVSCNKNYARDLKIKAEEIAGETDYEFYPKELAEKYRADDKRIMESGKTEDIEEKYIQYGQEVIVHTVKTPIKDEKGDTTGILGIFWDITERKRMEQEIQDKNEQLEVQNEELRATDEELRAANEELQATNEELRDAQEKLVRSEWLAAIGQLAGGVGHELRNPLSAIKNAVYYVRGKVIKSELGQKEPRVIEFLDIVDEEIYSSNKIINDLLGFSRVGKPTVSPTRIERVIEDALSYTTIPENIALTKRLNTDLPEVKIDTDQVRQVLVNIIINAVQAMPEGGKLTISAKEKDKFLEVEIADTGCGIPQEVISKIFDPLFTTRAKGIGLGLAVCKAIIDRHQGHIEVESQVGKGTTFNIRLLLKAK